MSALESRLITGALSRLAEVDQADAGEHPALPPSVAEWAALSPMRRTVMVADRLVQQAEAAGIEVGMVSLDIVLGVSLYAEKPELTPALAVLLLLERSPHTTPVGTERVAVHYRGARGSVRVRTHHTLPTSALAAEAVGA